MSFLSGNILYQNTSRCFSEARRSLPFTLLLSIIILEFTLYPRIKILGSYIRAVDVVALFSVAVCMLSFARRKSNLANFIEDNYVLLILILAILSGGALSTIFSVDRWTSLRKFIQLFERMSLIVLTLWAARRTLIPLILATIAVMVAFQSLLGFIQHLFNYGDVFIYDRVRISGTLGNYLASYLLLGFIVTLTYSTQRSNPRWFWLFLSGLILIALVLVQVRTIWILAAFALALVFLFSVTSMKNTVGILSVLVISVVLFFAIAGVMRTSGTSNIFSTLERRSNTTGVLRLELWSSAVKMFRDHPLVGVGLGNFMKVYHQDPYKSEIIDESDPIFGLTATSEFDAHSDFFTKLAEMGTVGTIQFAIFYLFLLRWAWTIGRRMKDSSEGISISIIIITSVIATVFSNPLGGNLYWIFVGLLWIVVRESVKSARPQLSSA